MHLLTRAFSATLLIVAAGCTSSAQRLDLFVRGGQVLDGSGQPPQRADIGVSGDRIVRIGDLTAEQAGQVIDATGLMVAPGFVHAQAQSGTTASAAGYGQSHPRQGITTGI